jgi:uncharacterized protein (DUF2267 family)
MSRRSADVFDRPIRTSQTWLSDVADVFGTDDLRFACRVVRAWLHTVRDRLTVPEAVHFGAQLPELLRGVYYDGWNPVRAPVKYGPDEFVTRFAREAMIPVADVRWTAARVSLIMQAHVSPGQLDHVLAQLPAWLRDIVGGVDLAEVG